MALCKLRKKAVAVAYSAADTVDDLEYYVVKVRRFFAEEHIGTVFPEAMRYFAALQERSPSPVGIYLVFTFQANKGAMEAVAPEDALAERAAVRDADVSSLIAYTPASSVWKDESREVFFDFMKRLRLALLDVCGDATADGDDGFFLDWPDPATGIPVNTERGGSCFNDCGAVEEFFAFESVLVAGPGGGCRITQHPLFGLNMYPAAGVLVLPQSQEKTLGDALNTWKHSKSTE